MNFKMERFTFLNGDDSVYMRSRRGEWKKGFALIIGNDNVSGYILEMVCSYTDANGGIHVFYKSLSTIQKVWNVDATSNWNIHCEKGFKEYGDILIIHSGFEQVGTYHIS